MSDRDLAPILRALIAAQLACALALAKPAAAQSTLAITNVTVISMADSAPLRGHTVIVRDGIIEQVGPSGTVRVPVGSLVVDGTGKFVIPGLFDMHVHTSKTRASALGLQVVHGITTARDQGSEHAEVLRWRREVNAGTRIGPRLIIAGPYLESRNNIERMRRDPPESRVEPFERARIGVGSPADAERIVDSLAKLEIDHLKVRTIQNRETYIALGRAARARGLKLTGHAVSPSPAALLEAGQAGVEHPFLLHPDSLPDSTRMSFWRELAARDVGVVPTLVVFRESVLRPQSYYDSLVTDSTARVHPLRPYLSKFLVLDWREQAGEQSPARRKFFQDIWPTVVRHVREMREAGVRLMAGSDLAVLNIFPGLSLHQELEFFVDTIGMSPREALASATREPAEWLGILDKVGTIEVGKEADMLLLHADPLADISNTRCIDAVVLRGKLLDRKELDALLERTRAMPDIRVNDWVR
jgi:imidazolonepropionase-like amidohydrolase